jgi:copper transport protein
LTAFAIPLVIAITSMSAAFAHAVLVVSSPAEGESIATTQNELYLKFSEAIEPRFSNFKLDSAEGGNALTLAATVDRKDRTSVLIQLPQPLHSGRYFVRWKVVTADTHGVEGRLPFSVK